MVRFSIVVPAYNAEVTLAETLDAIVAQGLDDWECVVVDDGSTDATRSIADSFVARDARFRLISQENRGSAGAYNTGVAAAQGGWVVLCSADDVLLPEHLAAMLEFIDANPGYDIFSSNGYYLNPNGSREIVYFTGEIGDSLSLTDVIRDCFYSVGAAYRRELYVAAGGYRVEVFGEDYDFWLRTMAMGAKHRYLSRPLSLHRVSSTQKSSDIETALRSDMRLITDLESSADLSEEERRAVRETVDARERRIDRMHESPGARGAVSKIASALLGRAGLRRTIGVLRSCLKGSRRTVVEVDLKPGQLATKRVLVIPSWYPSEEYPTAGVFIHQQVQALRESCAVAVLYVREATDELPAVVESEDGVPVARAQLKMPPVSHTIPGRARAVATNLYNRFFRYRRAGLAAFEALRERWGMPDIVHVQALWPAGLTARAIKRKYGIPYVVTEHSEEYLAQSERRLVRTPGMLPLVLRPLARDASCTIAVSRFLASRLVELGLAADPIVIPNVVPVSEPSPLPFGSPHVISHVSSMGLAKNLTVLLHAVDVLRGRRGDFVLRLAGDGECRADREVLAASLGLDDFVEFVGRKTTDDVRHLFAQSAFTVISSTHETFSVVAAESLMCGRPVLSTRCGGPEEFITPEVGRLIDAGSVDALADGLDWMLDHYTEYDPRELHEYARERFVPDIVAEQILKVYRSVLDA
ncbi:MAG: glycosyltransferase [Coriobacteriia bacterium]|nr:glycosyltransferase [Coriobacteriia bacterium]